MKRAILLVIVILTSIAFKAQTLSFNNLLQKHVDDRGFVDYKSFKKDKDKLKDYLSYIENTNPNKSWSANKEKSFWINVYNAYTIYLVIENYPVKSIMDIKKNEKSAWKIPFVKVGGSIFTLDDIEHEILRKKFSDPRIHVGVNCASISCPKLANVVFTEENIDAELDRLMISFINDTSKNKISINKIQLSSIFDWFTEDFTKNTTLIEYLNKYSNSKIDEKAKINYLKYNWSLNEN